MTRRIPLARPIEDLRRVALDAVPPEEPGPFLEPDLTELGPWPGLRVDLRYATADNVFGASLYDPESARARLQRPAAEALRRAGAALAGEGFGLLVFDAYRPWRVTWMMWEATPEPLRAFVADPRRGSRHNRGCAVDLTLFELATGRAVDMGGDFDDFSPRARFDCPDLAPGQSQRRETLRRALSAEGFAPLDEEWWHFDYHDWPRYPILNEPL